MANKIVVVVVVN